MKKIALLTLAFVLIGGGLFLLERNTPEVEEPQATVVLFDKSGKRYVFKSKSAADEFQDLNGIALKSLCVCYSKGERKAVENIDSLMIEDKFAVCDTTTDDEYRIKLFNDGYRAFVRLDSFNIYVNSLSAFDTAAQYISQGVELRSVLDTCFGVFLTSDGKIYQAENEEDLRFFERKLDGVSYQIKAK